MCGEEEDLTTTVEDRLRTVVVMDVHDTHPDIGLPNVRRDSGTNFYYGPPTVWRTA